MTGRTQGRVVLGVALAMLAGPVLADWITSGPDRLFGYVAADTFYYLVVGRHAGHGVVAYDGVHPSNGFHPLWQLLVALPYAVRLLDKPNVVDLVVVLGVSLVCLVGTVWLLGLALRRPDGSLNPLFALLPVGGYALVVCPAWLTLSLSELRAQNALEGSEPLYGTLWSYVNGMESPLALLTFAAAFLLWAKGQAAALPARYGAVLAALALARLDHLFVAAPLAGLGLWELRRDRRAAFRLLVGFAAPVVVYLAINRVFFGSLLPISGKLKSSVPLANAETFDAAVGVFNSVVGAGRPPIYLYWRVLQLVVPALAVALSPLVLARARRMPAGLELSYAEPRQGPFLAAAGLGVLALIAYDFFFVHLLAMGHWYVPVPVLMVSLLLLYGAERVPVPRSNLWGVALVAVFAVIGGAFFLRLHRHPDYHQRYARFSRQEAPLLRARFRGDAPWLLEFDDGIVSWATGFPAMSASGFGLDAEAALALQRGDLLRLASARGYDQLTSLVYFGGGGMGPNPSPEVLRAWAQNVRPAGDITPWRLSLTWRSETTDFVIVRFAR